jgi:hypothetical protein
LAVQRIHGVTEAGFSYERAGGFVTFDTTLTTVLEIAEELERVTGFVGVPRSVSPNPAPADRCDTRLPRSGEPPGASRSCSSTKVESGSKRRMRSGR